MKYKTMNRKTKFSDQIDFRTPPYLFHYISSLYGEIQFDGACFEDGSNALAQPLRLENNWPNGIIYSNPPFDDDSIISWILKGFEHTRKNEDNVHIMIIPNKLNHVKIQKNAFNYVDEIIFLGGRVDFKSEYSTKGGTSRNGSLILIQNKKIKNRKFSFKLLSELKNKFNNDKVNKNE